MHHTPGPLRRTLRLLAAGTASFLALLVGAVLLGAYLPAIPKIGVIGPVLGGQYPLHLALLALVAGLLGAAAWRAGLVRWGRAVTAVTAAGVVAALVIAGTQTVHAARAGTDISFDQMFTAAGVPDAAPDETPTYASPGGQPLKVDVYLPDRARYPAATPAIVLAHAGGFHTFDKSDLAGTGRWLADHGVATFAVDYRLATAATPTWDQSPQDLVCALGWVGGNATRYGVDPARISLGGMSAGGALALTAAYRLHQGTIGSSCGPTPTAPAAVVGFYPATDVTEMWTRDVGGSRNAAVLFTGGTPGQFPDRYRQVSPVGLVQAGLPRTLLVVGDRDRSATPDGVKGFGRALAGQGVDTRVEVLPFAEHAFDDAYGSLPAQASRQILLEFLSPGTARGSRSAG